MSVTARSASLSASSYTLSLSPKRLRTPVMNPVETLRTNSNTPARYAGARHEPNKELLPPPYYHLPGSDNSDFFLLPLPDNTDIYTI